MWFSGANGSREEPGGWLLHNTKNESPPTPRPNSLLTSSPAEFSIVGPLETASSIRSLRGNPTHFFPSWFEKVLRDENQYRLINKNRKNDYGSTLKDAKQRPTRSTGINPLGMPNRPGMLYAPPPSLMPQQQLLLMQRQQQANNAAIMRLHMLAAHNRRLALLRNRHRLSSLYRDYSDEDDSESDEYEHFDSHEFMPHPFRTGFMPPMPGMPFMRRGRK